MKKTKCGNPRGVAAVSGGTFLVICALLAVFSHSSCRRADRPRNIILITLDTQRADYIGAYAGGKAATPNIDELAAKSVLFENAWSLVPITLPSHASMFYSLPPHALKSYSNGQALQIPREYPSLANILRRDGFATAGFVSLGVLGRSLGIAEGFMEYSDEFPGDRWYLTAEEVNARVLPWLEKRRDEKFFLWIHYSDPHDPYVPPDAPDDLFLSLNGEPLGSYCLSKYLTFDVVLNLKAGINTLRFRTKNPYEVNAEMSSARLDRLDFIPPPDEVNLRTRHTRGWHLRRERNKFLFKDDSTLEIFSRTSRPVRMIFRGKLLVPTEKAQGVVSGLYRNEVEYMDAQIGRLWSALERLGLFATTAIVVAGDHGEGLGEYLNDFGEPHFGHIHHLMNVYMKVPLIVYRPGGRAGRRAEPVSLVDIAPTVCGLAGLPVPRGAAGRNLLGRARDPKARILEYTFRPDAVHDKFGIRVPGWHLIFTPDGGAYDLYDLERDPDELTNIFGEPGLPAEARSLERDLNEFARDVLKSKIRVNIDAVSEEMLRSLGYMNN